MPWLASTRRTTPSQAARLRDTSYPKSTWPGVSIRLMTWSFQSMPHVLGLDRDAPLALDVHRVEVLRPHVAGVDRPGQLEEPVGQRRLAVVDVRDDREVAQAREIGHCPILARRSTAAPYQSGFGPTATVPGFHERLWENFSHRGKHRESEEAQPSEREAPRAQRWRCAPSSRRGSRRPERRSPVSTKTSPRS